MGCRRGSGNEGLTLLAALTAIEIAREVEEDQAALLSAFFVVLGDQLALLAAPPWGCLPCSDCTQKDTEG